MLCIVRQIFTEDMDEVRSLPRENVLNFIEKADESLVVPYLVSDVIIIFCVISLWAVAYCECQALGLQAYMIM